MTPLQKIQEEPKYDSKKVKSFLLYKKVQYVIYSSLDNNFAPTSIYFRYYLQNLSCRERV